MTLKEIEQFCLVLKGSEKYFPFGEDTIVFGLNNKMFCLISLNKNLVNVKVDSWEIDILIENYDWIIEGYHMNKKHWISIDLTKEIEEDIFKDLIKDSYELVFNKLNKTQQNIILYS